MRGLRLRSLRPRFAKRASAVVMTVLALAGCSWGGDVPAGGEAVSLDVFAVPEQPRTGAEVVWVLEVSNASEEPATLLFRSTQRGNVVLEAHDAEIYSWAEGRAFSRQVEEEVILPGDSITFELQDIALAAPPGEYELVGSLMGIPTYMVATETVTVEEPLQ